MEYGVLAADTD